MPVMVNIYTDFFKRDLQIYALGDIRFQKPKSLKAVGCTVLLMFVWALPLFLIIGPSTAISGPIPVAIIFGPPVLLGSIMSKPFFHHKPLIKDIFSIGRYLSRSKEYAEMGSLDDAGDYGVAVSLWVSDPVIDDDGRLTIVDEDGRGRGRRLRRR